MSNNEIHRDRLLWAGFVAILAAGVGFAVRGGIFDNWAGEYGFTGAQLGAIGGAGFSGFCFGIIIGGVIVDKIGYGKLVFLAFACHVLSAFVTFAPGADASTQSAYNFLFWGMFIFAYANGTLEAVANPLVATLYPENRTHYLNILHASWPAGMIVGALVGWYLDDQMGIHWKWQLAIYLVPTIVYGVMYMGQKYPRSEAAEKGLGLGEMLKDVGILGGLVICYLVSLFLGASVLTPLLGAENAGMASTIGYLLGFAFLVIIGVITKFSVGSFLMFVLFVAHLLVGAVELGTDGWIQNITGNILSSTEGKWLFIWTSTIMFVLRFCAHFIESKLGLSPVGILLVCSVLAVVGLIMASSMTGFISAMLALGIYAVGKTFFWPTMLAVVGDRFPRSGAVAMSIMGGIGMLSAGLIGSTGLGFAKDHYAGQELKAQNAALYEEVKSGTPSSFLGMTTVGIDGAKLSEAQGRISAGEGSAEDQTIADASIVGDRKTLKADAFIPATMAVIYILIMLYFKGRGGYKPVSIDEQES